MLVTALRQGGRIAVEPAVLLLLCCTAGFVGCRDADVNRDGVVDAADLTFVDACLGADPSPRAPCAAADADGDGTVDGRDRAYVVTRLHLQPLPRLVASDPLSGAASVPRSAWLRLEFDAALAPGSLRTFALRCGDVPRMIRALRLADRVVLVNPRDELPPSASCVLDWAGAEGPDSLAFTTAAAGAAATVFYDRTDTTQVAPLPDDGWLVPDPSTETGHRVAIPVPDREPDVVQLFGSLTRDTALLDGFSPLAPIVVELSDAPDPASLPMTVAASLDPLASVGLFDLTPGGDHFGERVPFQLHLRDDDVGDQPTAHTLVAFPSIPLAPGGRYGFVITRRARADATRPFEPSAFFAAVLSRALPGEDAAVTAVRGVARDVLSGIVSATPPIPAEDVALALRISVRSTSDLPRDLLAMKRQVLDAPPPAVTITAVTESSAARDATLVRGNWRAPSWREGAFLARDEAGVPRITRTVGVPFVIVLPPAANSGPVPVVMYHHGNPGSADELETATPHLRRAGFAVAGFTDVFGRAYGDVGRQLSEVFGTLYFGARVPDLWVQTYGEQLAFVRALETLATRDWLPRNARDGIPELDLSLPLGFLGMSYGASLGQAFLAYAPEVQAAALVGGGARLAELLFHQDATDPFGVGGVLDLVTTQVPNARAPDVWAGLSLFQMLFDAQDPHGQAAFLHRDPIEVAGTVSKASLLLVEGIDDSFLPANASRSLAWNAGPLAQLAPIHEPVPFLEPAAGSLLGNLEDGATGALVQYTCGGIPSGEGQFCAQDGSKAQQVAFLRSALGGHAPVILAADLDTDGDGLLDVEEAVHGSNRRTPDTDGDGLLDGVEVQVGLDPLNAADAASDRDGDGLSNATEIALGMRIDRIDSDGDGYRDDREVAHGTDPVRRDTDGGGRSDGEEVNRDHTDPLDRFDDLPLARLPAEIQDGKGVIWRIGDPRIETAQARTYEQLLSVYAVSGRDDLRIFSPFEAPTEDGGRELSIGSSGTGALRLSRKVYVPIGEGFLRTLDRLTNITEDPIAVDLRLSSPARSPSPSLLATASGDGIADPSEAFLVHVQRPPYPPNTIAHVYAGSAPDPDPRYARPDVNRYSLVVPPRGAIAVMAFVVVRSPGEDVVAAAAELADLSGGALAGLSSAERKEIVNFAAAPDADGDGVLDFDEGPIGTDPANPDSDGDGLFDGFEVDHGFDPLFAGDELLDPDDDAVPNLAEQGLGTDPLVADTDDDGLSDGEEVAHATDPLRRDTDRDGMIDAQEVSLGTDPLDPRGDADADSLLDADEVLRFGTDPLRADTDGDGLRDDAELRYGLDPRDGTDAAADPDGDGLPSARELELGTRFWDDDTDDDLLDDGTEVALGLDPLDAEGDADGGGRTDARELLRDGTDPLVAADDHAVVSLPFDLVGPDGRSWRIERDASISTTGIAPRLIPGTVRFYAEEATQAPADPDVTVSYFGLWPFRSLRRIHLSPDGRWVRVLDSVGNPSDRVETAVVELPPDFRVYDETPEFVATSSGDEWVTPEDDWHVVDDADGSGAPALALVFSGPGAAERVEQSWSWLAAVNVGFWFDVSPGDRRSVMSFVAQSPDRAEALALAETLRSLGGGALDGLGAAERAAIVNFAAPPP